MLNFGGHANQDDELMLDELRKFYEQLDWVLDDAETVRSSVFTMAYRVVNYPVKWLNLFVFRAKGAISVGGGM